MLIIFGEVLYDCFPGGHRVLGGAPFNVAWHCQAFGLKPLLITRIGKDILGEEIRSSMLDWGMNPDGLQIDETHPTGIVDIQFINGEPFYDIAEKCAWDFIDGEILPVVEKNSMLYHGSLAMRNSVSNSALKELKNSNKFPVYVDINLRNPWWSVSKIQEIIGDCDYLKLNEGELAIIAEGSNDLEEDMKNILSKYSLEVLIVTQGEKGAIVIDDKSNISKVSPEVNIKVIDTVGAGDAFSSIMLVGQYYDWPLNISLKRAQEFASGIVGIHGATINDKSFYKSFSEKWDIPLSNNLSAS